MARRLDVDQLSFFFRWLLLLLLVWAHVLIGCRASKPDLTWQHILERGALWVGMDASWVPFEYLDETGQLSGFDVVLARELGKRLGLEVQYVPNLSFDGLYDALTAGQVDVIISAVVVDPGRSADFTYSIPYFDAGQVIVVGPSGTGIGGMEALQGRVLAVELGSDGDIVARRWARRLAGLSVLHANSADDALAAVFDGQADAALTDRATALMALKAHGDGGNGLRINGSPVTGEQYAMVTRKESSRLLRALNAVLVDMRDDGTLQELEREWLGP